jgi:transcriptional regulator with GAF, ATPase, and Fis domain
VELADGGTLFFDEIGELSARSTSSCAFWKSGCLPGWAARRSARRMSRVVTATNRDLSQEVDGARSEDLYYRLNVFPITLPRFGNTAKTSPTSSSVSSRSWPRSSPGRDSSSERGHETC